MPVYDYECEGCQAEFTDTRPMKGRHFSDCPRCGNYARKVWNSKAPGISLFEAGWFRDISYDPIHCSTPQELKDACDRHGARSEYIENSSAFRTHSGEERRYNDACDEAEAGGDSTHPGDIHDNLLHR